MDLYQISLTCPACGSETKGVIVPTVKTLLCQSCGANVSKVKRFDGVVYVMSNPHMPNVVKVGMTCKDVYERAKELSQTGVPGTYQVDAIFPAHRPKQDEEKAHAKLKKWNIPKSEHFNLNPVDAIVKVRSALQGRDAAMIHEQWREAVSAAVEKNRTETMAKLKKPEAEHAKFDKNNASMMPKTEKSDAKVPT